MCLRMYFSECLKLAGFFIPTLVPQPPSAAACLKGQATHLAELCLLSPVTDVIRRISASV